MVDVRSKLPFICRQRGCDQIATHLPVVRVWAVGRPKTPGTSAQIALQIGMCLGHATTATPEEVFTDDGWEEISAAIQARGFAKPDRASAEVHAQPISSMRPTNV